MASSIPSVILSTGHAMPVLAMGTISFPLTSPDALQSAILEAIALGYRHFDTASVYGSEQPLGNAIREAMRLGLVKSRDEFFITTKLWTSDAYEDRLIPALEDSLRNLQLEYVDLYLIHWPICLTPGPKFPFGKERLRPMEIKSVWGKMEECNKLGLAKSIGVELHPVWQQKKLINFCKEKGIQVVAYSPLGGNGAAWGTMKVMECVVLKEIAGERKKSLPQISLRWIYEQGAAIIVKSFNKERMTVNTNIFDWELTKEELDKIGQIPQWKGCRADDCISESGPFKSLEEFWDGEI